MTDVGMERWFALLIAGATVGVQVGCGPCPEPDDVVFPVLPAGNGDRTGLDEVATATELTCATECLGAASCDPITIEMDDGSDMPAVSCSFFAECVGGRRPLHTPHGLARLRSVGAWLHHTAALEADSVGAFRQLARDLRRFGAPRRLVRGAQRSARDEVRHARAVSALARRYGARGAQLSVPPTPTARARDLTTLAAHNAAEGCVHEAYAALTAHYQARHARDPVVRAAFRRVARDETRHAALSMAVDRWAWARLPAAGREPVRRARASAERRLLAHAGRTLPASWRAPLGLPSASVAMQLAKGFVAGRPTSRPGA